MESILEVTVPKKSFVALRPSGIRNKLMNLSEYEESEC
jgi:hypothetical protein